MAFTGDVNNAGSDTRHYVELLVQQGGPIETRQVQLPLKPAGRGLGKLFNIILSNFGFSFQCITYGDIKGVSINERSNDGWFIAHVVTYVRDVDGGVEALTENFALNKWVDGNRGDEERSVALNHLVSAGKLHAPLTNRRGVVFIIALHDTHAHK